MIIDHILLFAIYRYMPVTIHPTVVDTVFVDNAFIFCGSEQGSGEKMAPDEGSEGRTQYMISHEKFHNYHSSLKSS